MNAARAIPGSRAYPADVRPARLELLAMRAGEALVAWSQAHRLRRTELARAAATPDAIAIRRAAQVEAQQVLLARDAAGNRSLHQRIF